MGRATHDLGWRQDFNRLQLAIYTKDGAMPDWTDGIGEETFDMMDPATWGRWQPHGNPDNWKKNCEIVMNNPELPPADPTGTLNGTWLKKVWSGLYVDLQNPTPDMVHLDDISVSLHNQCRYNGHTEFYSVAEHSVIAAKLAIEDGRSEDEVRAVLMHDASECYLGDMSRVLKLYLRSIGVTIYDELSAKWDAVIGERFGIDFVAHHDVIKFYDFTLMKAEKMRFWPEDTQEWSCLDGIPYRNVDWLNCKPDDVHFWCCAVKNGIKIK